MKKRRLIWWGVIWFLARPFSSAEAVGRYDVFELTVSYPSAGLADPFNDAVVVATFTAPSGKTLVVPGFYYDVDTYKVRFAPAEIGAYSYAAAVTGPTAAAPWTGSFTATNSLNHGFIRRLPGSPYKLMHDDGSLFYGVGLNDCWALPAPGAGLQGIIGDPAVEPAGEGGPVPVGAYFQKYGTEGGFNLFRWNPGNCSFDIRNVPDPVANGKLGDQLLQAAKAGGFYVMYTFFYNPNAIPDPIQHPNEDAKFKRDVRYAVARFGAYVDMWEWSNETQSNMDAWLAYARNYLYTVDPYQRLITNSNPTSHPPNIDVESPHKYGNNLDFFTLTNKTSGPPMVPGEVGRCAGCGTTAYTPQTVAKMRITDWTGFFAGVGVIYWNTSAKTTCCNQYMGSKERAHNLVLKNFATGSNVDPDAQAAAAATGPNRVGYTLTSRNSLVAYIYDGGFSALPVTTTLALNVPFNGTAAWLDPKTGQTVAASPVTAGVKTLATPGFVEDIALRITPAAPVDAAPPAPPRGLRRR